MHDPTLYSAITLSSGGCSWHSYNFADEIVKRGQQTFREALATLTAAVPAAGLRFGHLLAFRDAIYRLARFVTGHELCELAQILPSRNAVHSLATVVDSLEAVLGRERVELFGPTRTVRVGHGARRRTVAAVDPMQDRREDLNPAP